jgi:protein-S-isoprenylcysteine O-methyltransferase Ste14
MALQEEFEAQGLWLFRYRGIIPVFILIIGIILFLRTEINPEIFFLKNTPFEIYFEMCCLVISLIGLGIRVFTIAHTPINTSGRNTRGQLAEKLNTTGMYSIVRHPLYLGNFFMWLGPAMITGHFWFIVAFSLFYWIYYEKIMFAEEQFLRKKFGEEYSRWAANVPAFIPDFSKFRKPELSFSLKKVLKKEKNGLAAIFLIFCFFDVYGELSHGRSDFNYFVIVVCMITVLMYGILKYLKRKTQILNEDGR